LSPGIDPQTNPSTLVSLFGTIFSNVCHELCCLGLVLLVLSAPQLKAQTFRPALPTPDQPDQPSTNPNQHLKIAREHGPSPGEKYIEAVDQVDDGPWRHLKGAARVETDDFLLKGDEIDYNDETAELLARGHVHFEHFSRGERIDCDELEYNMDDESGTFYNVSGSAPSSVQARPGLLTTQNPFYFHSKWAERVKDRYILHDGFLTDCIVPDPWWTLKGPEFILIPGDHAIARRSWFYLKKMPLFYTPWFYKSLKKQPRRSGFLVPNIGTSSLHGKMIGFGYYWAISRSFDLLYQGLYYTQAGLANNAEFRGKINSKTDFDLNIFGVLAQNGAQNATSGERITLNAKSDLGDGWQARGVLDYLSGLAFLQDFTQSFNEAVSSETHSVGFVTKHWNDLGVDFVAERDVAFQDATPGNTIEVRKLPSAEVSLREHEVDFYNWPFWVTFGGSAGLLDRSQPEFQTRQFVDRVDFEPQITTRFHWGDFYIVPTVGITETEYGESFQVNTTPGGVNTNVIGANLLRSSRNVTVDLIFPSLERVFKAPKWMGDKVKHIIEPRIEYKDVSGIDNFNQIIRFDQIDLLSNTNQVEFSLTNRLLAKDKNGTVTDFLTWQLRYDRYFDPTFGGAVVAGQRNVVQSEIDLTGFAFLAGPRNYSPIVSVLRLQSRLGFEWRADYDPLYHRVTNSSVSVDGRVKSYYWSVGNTEVHTNPVLLPSANQVGTTLGYGNPRSKGWNTRFQIYYDFHQDQLLFWDVQLTKNTDCCGFSLQYRRINIGIRDDSQYLFAFAISNIGTIGSLKPGDRTF
jgi:LPS-assembly protein